MSEEDQLADEVAKWIFPPEVPALAGLYDCFRMMGDTRQVAFAKVMVKIRNKLREERGSISGLPMTQANRDTMFATQLWRGIEANPNREVTNAWADQVAERLLNGAKPLYNLYKFYRRQKEAKEAVIAVNAIYRPLIKEYLDGLK